MHAMDPFINRLDSVFSSCGRLYKGFDTVA